jgi:hypothetical protein
MFSIIADHGAPIGKPYNTILKLPVCCQAGHATIHGSLLGHGSQAVQPAIGPQHCTTGTVLEGLQGKSKVHTSKIPAQAQSPGVSVVPTPVV